MLSDNSLILIAEDDSATRLLMRNALEREGYRVEEAMDGLDAIETCQRVKPDMILMDAVMPKMNGFEACEHLKKKLGNNGNAVPILTITGLNDEASVERSYEVGAHDFITKPIHWPVLLQRMRRILDANSTKKTLVRERHRADEERTRLERQLRQAHKMEAIGRLTGGIAHDFNNILAAIMGYTDLIREKLAINDTEKPEEYLYEISRAGERARDLVKQMLSFSRQGEIKGQLIDMKFVVSEVGKLLRSTLPSAIQLDFDLDRDLPVVLMDPVQLHQCVMNLCINACQVMEDKGKITVTLKKITVTDINCDACHQLFSGDHVELIVKDDGPGISDETLERIFDPFFTTKEVGRGTGMGLAVVHGIVHQFNGHIRVITGRGEGAEFHLYLPVSDKSSLE